MRTRIAVVAALAVVGGAVAGPATPPTRSPSKLKVRTATAAVSRPPGTATANQRQTGRQDQKARGDNATLRFKVPKGYYLYFAPPPARTRRSMPRPSS